MEEGFWKIFGIIASAASIISLGFALIVYHREQIKKERETGNIRVFKERIKNIHNNLNGTVDYLQMLIRQADDLNTPVRELQNMARGVRAGLVGSLLDAREATEFLERWKVGELLKSEGNRSIKENKNQINHNDG